MEKWQEYNPDSGLYETSVIDGDRLLVHKQQDVTELVEATKAIANSQATDIGIKKGFWHYCSIPIGVQYEMLNNHGVNIFQRDHWPKVIALINEHYPYLKTTHKKHHIKRTGKIYAAS